MSVLRRAAVSDSTSRSRRNADDVVGARPWRFRRPPRSSVAAWEKDFCESRGVPWLKVTDPLAGLNAEGPGGRVALWDDSAAEEALLAAKKRYLAEINGGARGVPPLPDPDMYIDAVDDEEDGGGGGAVDDKDRAAEAEYEAAVRDMERAREESARLRAAMLRDDFVPVPTGWVA
ncbi:unnamed protein product [Urochloa decumbens]|uniref:Uncharacterized protein n=1 Tax=Urochloa decumbens TaxID=240449 RepID=A0ABC9GG96_9POAL